MAEASSNFTLSLSKAIFFFLPTTSLKYHCQILATPLTGRNSRRRTVRRGEILFRQARQKKLPEALKSTTDSDRYYSILWRLTGLSFVKTQSLTRQILVPRETRTEIFEVVPDVACPISLSLHWTQVLDQTGLNNQKHMI